MDLTTFLEKNKDKINEKTIIFIIHEIMQGLAFMQSNDFSHPCLTLENIFINER